MWINLEILQNLSQWSSEFSPLGDINEDGSVNIFDVIILIEYIIYNESSNVLGFDINSDGEVNVDDIISLVNIILDI